MVCSSLIYACEARDMTDTNCSPHSEWFQQLSVIFKCDIQEMVANSPFDLIITIRRRRLKFLGHTLRMEPDGLVRWNIIALIKEGIYHPMGSLFIDVENPTIEELVRLAQDR